MPTTLITGANGFTGRYLTSALAKRGHRLCGLVRDAGGEPDDALDESFAADLADADETARILSHVQPDFVVHLAAVAFVAHGDLFDMYRTNIFGTRCLLDACARLPATPRSIIVASSANVYGNSTEGVLAEDSPIMPANDYGVTKAGAEHLARLYSHNLPIIVTRPFNYTGRGQHESFLVPKIVNAVKNRAPSIQLGNIDVERDISDVRSLVEAYVRLLESPGAIGQTFNVSSGRVISLRHIVEEAGRLAGYKIEVEVNPDLIRANEIRSLCGDSRKLDSVIGPRPAIPFEQTLEWMLGD